MNTPTIEGIFVDGRWTVQSIIMTKDFQIVTVSTIQISSPIVDRFMEKNDSEHLKRAFRAVKQIEKNHGQYETMVFDNHLGNLSELDRNRYHNRESAREGHQLMIERWVNRGNGPKTDVREKGELG